MVSVQSINSLKTILLCGGILFAFYGTKMKCRFLIKKRAHTCGAQKNTYELSRFLLKEYCNGSGHAKCPFMFLAEVLAEHKMAGSEALRLNGKGVT